MFLRYQLAYFLAIENPNLSSKDVLIYSKKLMNNNYINLFSLYCSSFLWWITVPLTFGISLLFVIPYQIITVISFYKYLIDNKDSNTSTIKNSDLKMNNNKIFYIVITLISIFIAAFVKILNFGWVILLLGFVLIIHSIFLLISNINIANYAHKSLFLKILFLLSCVSFLLAYICFPDYVDTNGYHVLFKIIYDKDKISILSNISSYCFKINFVTIFIGFFSKFIANIKNSNLS